MLRRMTLVLMCAFALAGMAILAYAADDNMAEDNFLTSTVSTIFNKVNKVASGEEPILVKDYNKSDTHGHDYTTDALGRKIAEPTIRTTGALPPTKEEKAKAAAEAEKQAPKAPASE